MSPAPDFFQYRLDLFEKLKAKQDEEIKNKPRLPITVTLPDGSVKEGTSWETSPLDIAGQISKSLVERTVIAKVTRLILLIKTPSI